MEGNWWESNDETIFYYFGIVLSRLGLYIAHLLSTLILAVMLGRVSLTYDNYIDLIGWDESYWIFGSECAWFSSFDLCWAAYLSIYPMLIKAVQEISNEFFLLIVVKTLIYTFSVRFLIKSFKISQLSEYNPYACFLLLNPYIILLHVSGMRDDIIVSLVLILVGLLLRANTNTSTIPILSAFIFSILIGMFRFGYGVWSLVFFSYLYAYYYWKEGAITQALLITTPTIYILLWIDIIDFVPEFDVSIQKLFISLYELLFSPLITNIANGAVIDIGSDIAHIWWYAIIYPQFSMLCTALFLLWILGLRGGLHFPIRENLALLIFAIGLLVPYLFSTQETQGPRQSLPATVLFFYIFGIPVIRYLIGVSGAVRGSISYPTK